DLAAIFRRRIELRQIGVRDEARMCGGLGCCGREFCCSTFLNEFQPVSIKMAKEQNLSMNPEKISGACGRLLCCLNYEQEAYAEARRRLPKRNDKVNTPDGPGVVHDVSLLTEKVTVSFEKDDERVSKSYKADELS
ncbi:MAG: regulatory iron-sulfur-containing complex subunit RicT, partial [Eubacteriales bacterium]|nr:regulatory iron-sulfur-containing complex subunit RicT [Eubacteriales bacterium]